MSAKTRLSPREKIRIFLKVIKDNMKVAEVCRREEIKEVSTLCMRFSQTHQ